MEQHTKKQVMIGVIVVCFVIAGAITLTTRSRRSGNRGTMSRGKIWVLCRNPDCQAKYQIKYDDYFDYMVKHRDRLSDVNPPMPCEKCGEPSVYEAIKCEKCGLVYEPGSIPGDLKDRCPKCRYSKSEEERKRREAAGGG